MSDWQAIKNAAVRNAAARVLTDSKSSRELVADAMAELQHAPMTAGEAIAGMTPAQLYALREALATIFPS